MAEELYTLYCYVIGDAYPVPIKISSNETIGVLKEEINAKRKLVDSEQAHNLIMLWPIDFPDDEDLKEHAHQFLSSAPLARPLRPNLKLSTVFKATPEETRAHILVRVAEIRSRGMKRKAPSSETDSASSGSNPISRRRYESPLIPITDTTARRESTISALYERLNRYRFVLVRGTPASGKSTLAELLVEYISLKEPTVTPIVIFFWPNDGPSWSTRLTDMYNPNGPNTIIIDEAQLTYWDLGFWNNFLKNITMDSPNRIILFASYGSPSGRVSVEGTPMIVPDHMRVSLRPIDHNDGIAEAGLLLTSEEFADMVTSITAGHAGAVTDLLTAVKAHDSYRAVQRTKDRKYSLQIFKSHFPIENLWLQLSIGSMIRRGLPTPEELQKPNVAQVFRRVLCDNNVTMDTFHGSTENQDTLTHCFKSGWLHATMAQDITQYIFTTPLHQWFVEYYLGTKIADSTPITDQDLTAFSINVIKLFSHRCLSAPRGMGASSKQRTMEAQFQDEFYRCCHQYSNGSLISLSEFGTSSGSIDFYIPRGKWGIALLRDGDRLADHSSRFSGQGAYANMNFQDYILLDFRTSQPRKPHPQIPRLYHVVFTDGWKNVYILDGSSLEKVAEFPLLNHSGR